MAHEVAPKSNKNLDRHVEVAPKSIKNFSWSLGALLGRPVSIFIKLVFYFNVHFVLFT